MYTAEELVSGAVTLVTLPDVYWRVKGVIDDPDTTHQHMAKAIATDPGMTARLLRLVNSAHFGSHGRIEFVSRAVALLGMLHVHDLVLATSLACTFHGIRPSRMNVARFWTGSLYRAQSAAVIGRCAELADAERLFVEGLLSDIGHLVMYQRVPELAAAALERAGGDPDQLPKIERDLIGCDYAEVGAALTATWGLPDCFRAAIGHQNEPQRANGHALEAAVLHVAGRLAEHHLAVRDAARAPHVDPLVLSHAGLTPDHLPAVMEETRTNLAAIERILVSA